MIKKYILAIIAIVLAVWTGFSLVKNLAIAPDAPVNGVVEQANTAPASVVVRKNNHRRNNSDQPRNDQRWFLSRFLYESRF